MSRKNRACRTCRTRTTRGCYEETAPVEFKQQQLNEWTYYAGLIVSYNLQLNTHQRQQYNSWTESWTDAEIARNASRWMPPKCETPHFSYSRGPQVTTIVQQEDLLLQRDRATRLSLEILQLESSQLKKNIAIDKWPWSIYTQIHRNCCF